MRKFNYKIILAPTYQLAKPYINKVDATVEAEYGKYVIEGKRITLAHHVPKYAHMKAPCNQKVKPLKKNSTILISHIDLDTIGGVMALIGEKPKDDDFWEAVEYIDLNGPHHLKVKFPELENKFNAFWCWLNKQRKPSMKEVSDVTEFIYKAIHTIKNILQGDKSLLEEGERWRINTEYKVESCLAYEHHKFRVFITNDVSCSSAYYSKRLGKFVPYILTFNTKKKRIIFSTIDNGETINAKEFVKNLWGDYAGGHEGIAGSPKGQEMQLSDLNEAINYLKRLIRKRKINI